MITNRAIAVGLRNGLPALVVLTAPQQSSGTPIAIEQYLLYGLDSSGNTVPLTLNSSNGLIS